MGGDKDEHVVWRPMKNLRTTYVVEHKVVHHVGNVVEARFVFDAVIRLPIPREGYLLIALSFIPSRPIGARYAYAYTILVSLQAYVLVGSTVVTIGRER